MNTKKIVFVAICVCLVASFAAYEVYLQLPTTIQASDGDNNYQNSSPTPNTTDQSGGSTDPTDSTTTDPPTSTTTPYTSSSGGTGTTTSEVLAQNKQDHEDASDYVWASSNVIDITLNVASISTVSNYVTVEGSKATITTAGIYRVTGSLSDGQIIVDTADEQVVQIILNGVDISCSNSAPIYVLNADKVVLILEDNTQNYLRENAQYYTLTGDEPNAAVYSKSDLTIYGDGSLSASSAYNDGITSKDGLIIKSAGVTVNAQDDGIRGKDYLIVKSGAVSVNAGENGLISDDTTDSTRGYISIESGTVTVTSGGDAIDAQTDVIISGGQITLTSGGGSSGILSSSVSAKGVKGIVSVTIDGGSVIVNSADDAVHSNGEVTVNGGTLQVSTGDDGVHADSEIVITGGTLDVTKSYEGIEAETITINGGTIYVTASDDGINGAGGVDSSGFMGGPGGRGGGDAFMNSGSCNLYINGGYIVVTASGDGIDINGAITMTAGTVIVNGPTANNNGALDFSTFKMTGGFLIGVGSSGMAQALSTTSTQCSVLVNFQSAYSPETLIHIQSSSGTNVATFQPSKMYQSVVVCSPLLTSGSTYNVYLGGSCTGTIKDGLYSGGTYSGGTQYTSFTINSVVTSVGGRF